MLVIGGQVILEKTGHNFVSWVFFHAGPGPGLDEFPTRDTSGSPPASTVNRVVAGHDRHYPRRAISCIQFIFCCSLSPPGS